MPGPLKEFVDEQVKRGYGTSSEYVRELIRRDQDRLQLRGLVLAGAGSPKGVPADALERAYGRLSRHPTAGSSRYASELKRLSTQ